MSPLEWVTNHFRDVPEADSDSVTEFVYECRGCAARYELQYYVCPACQSFSVDPSGYYYLDAEHPLERSARR